MDQEKIDKLISNWEKAAKYLSNGGHGRTISEMALKGEREYSDACKALVKAGVISPLKKKYNPSIKNYRSSKA